MNRQHLYHSCVPAYANIGRFGFVIVCLGRGETEGPARTATVTVGLKRVEHVDAGIVTDAFDSRCDSG